MTSKVSIKLVFDLFVACIGLLAANLKLITFLMEPKADIASKFSTTRCTMFVFMKY